MFPVIKTTIFRINSLDTSMMVNLIPLIRQYIRRQYKRKGAVAIHSPAVGSMSCDCTFHSAVLMTLELNVEKTKRPPLPRIGHMPLIFVCYVT
jgi:hypothetical protein